MQVFTVGGFVRDRLLNTIGEAPVPHDRDWVVIGETPETMIRRGFLPVGEDFPVFLHPKTHEEYALARTERKTAPGYHGFVFHTSPDVTLEEDLRRRDLTINAIALSAQGELIDPYGGIKDLNRRILRHVSDAFAEDPVRILRLARFAAKFPSFSVAPATMSLMHTMVEAGEADALVPERVLAELTKGLATPTPCRMFDVLLACGLWNRVYPDIPLNSRTRRALHLSATANLPMSARFAALASGLPAPSDVKRFLASLRASADIISFAETLKCIECDLVHLNDPDTAASIFQRADALRRPERMSELLRYRRFILATDTDTKEEFTREKRIQAAFSAWRSVDAGAVAQAQATPKAIPSAVLGARKAAVKAAWTECLEKFPYEHSDDKQ